MQGASPGRLAGKVVVVSGSARGMGSAHVRLLAAEGAVVVATDSDYDHGREQADQIHGSVHYAHLDVTRPEQWEAVVADAVARFGRIDVLVNNAGMVAGSGVDVEAYDLDLFQKVMSVNFYGVLYGMRAVLPVMKAAGRGSIVNISSLAGITGWYRSAAYTASKFAVTGLTKSVALEVGSYGIRVNSVHPGVIDTPLTSARDYVTDHVALKRIGRVDEIASVVVFLASDESSFSTGAEYVIDGGETAGRAMPNFRREDSNG